MVLLEAATPKGTIRRCDGICHHAAGNTCNCICGGLFHGIGAAAEDVTYDEVADARQSIALAEGEHVQLRIGA